MKMSNRGNIIILCSGIIILLLVIFAIRASGQTVNNGSNPMYADRQTLHPDEHTVYFDESGKKIDAALFAAAVQTGKYSFVPAIEAGRVKSVQLKRSGQSLSPGQPFPAFAATDMSGNHFSLKELHGKTVVLDFWFAGCVACAKEMPELNKLREKYKDDTGIVFLAITYDPASLVKKFLAKKEFQFNIIPNRQDLISQWGITAFPTNIVIDKGGNIAFMLSSYSDTNIAQLDGVLTALKQ